MNRLARGLAGLRRTLVELRVEWALVGGLAISVRTEPRTTRDIDIAIAVPGDQEATELLRELQRRGYRVLRVIEQAAVERLAIVELASPGDGSAVVRVDVLFASSGIEPEVVRSAEPLRIFGGLTIPIARVPHLIAMKTLASAPDRPQDRMDLLKLLSKAESSDLEAARELLHRISARGFDRKKDLLGELEEALSILRTTPHRP